MQKIVVLTCNNHCRVQFEELVVWGFCGKNGTTNHKQEGDGKTPLGCFPIHFGFYRGERPVTKLPMVKIHPRHVWVDDPASPLYNRLVFGKARSHGELLWEHPLEYALGLAVEYNRAPTRRGAGSAIFFHCGNKPTAGCIAVPRDFLEKIITRLTPAQCPHLYIQ